MEIGVDITTTDIHECINFFHQKCQTNAELVSLIGMLSELIDTRDSFKGIPNLGKNEIIEYIISISTISLSWAYTYNLLSSMFLYAMYCIILIRINNKINKQIQLLQPYQYI